MEAVWEVFQQAVQIRIIAKLGAVGQNEQAARFQHALYLRYDLPAHPRGQFMEQENGNNHVEAGILDRHRFGRFMQDLDLLPRSEPCTGRVRIGRGQVQAACH